MPASSTARSRRAPLLVGSVFSLASALCLGGCWADGGLGVSDDTHVFKSTAWRPQTVTLVDTRTGESFWSQELPVGEKLVVKFLVGKGTEGGFTPDLMQWQVMPGKNLTGSLKNALPVPPATARRLDVDLRPTPELPADMVLSDAAETPLIIIEETTNGQ